MWERFESVPTLSEKTKVIHDEEKLGPSYIAAGNVKWRNHSGKQFGTSLKN